MILTASQPFTSKLILSNEKQFKYCWYWVKERGTGFTFAKSQPLRKVEEVCVFSKGKSTYVPQMVKLDKPYKHALPVVKSDSAGSGSLSSVLNSGERIYKEYTHSYPTNVLNFARDDNRKGVHPTQKPVALFEYLIKTYSQEGDTVLDCFAGSFTTTIAAMNTNRRYICIEKDPTYYQVGLDRIEQWKKIEEKS